MRLPSLSENLVESENSYKTSSRSAEKFSYFTQVKSFPYVIAASSLFTLRNAQIKGIPQGSVLSPILCNIYYGNAENKEFGGSNEVNLNGYFVYVLILFILHQRKLLGLDSNESVIVRMMDDYIMISTNRWVVKPSYISIS